MLLQGAKGFQEGSTRLQARAGVQKKARGACADFCTIDTLAARGAGRSIP